MPRKTWAEQGPAEPRGRSTCLHSCPGAAAVPADKGGSHGEGKRKARSSQRPWVPSDRTGAVAALSWRWMLRAPKPCCRSGGLHQADLLLPFSCSVEHPPAPWSCLGTQEMAAGPSSCSPCKKQHTPSGVAGTSTILAMPLLSSLGRQETRSVQGLVVL